MSVSPRDEERWRLRSDDGLVGYERRLETGVALYAKDRLYWTGQPIVHEHRDRWSGLRDIDRNYVYAEDVVYIRSLEVNGVHPQWVVMDQPWRLESLDGRETRPLFDGGGQSLYGFNDVRIVTHLWRSRELQRLRDDRRPLKVMASALKRTHRLVLAHVLTTWLGIGLVAVVSGSIGLPSLLLSTVVGAWIAHRVAGRREREWIRLAGLHSAAAHAVAGAVAYVVAWTQWPDALELSASQLAWAAPAVGFLVGAPALASVMLVGDVMAHVGGGYADEMSE